MKPKPLLSLCAYLLMSLAGGGSFLLPDRLDVPVATVTPAVALPPASLVGIAANTDDVASVADAMSVAESDEPAGTSTSDPSVRPDRSATGAG